jgi:exodeoxyribonuclease V alpha subunit
MNFARADCNSSVRPSTRKSLDSPSLVTVGIEPTLERIMSELEDLKGTVSELYFQGANFSTGKLKLSGSNAEVRFVGKFHVCKEQVVHFRGKFVINPKFGRQFEIAAIVSSRELDADGMVAWLQSRGAGLGIGPVKAKKIIAEFGDTFATVLLTEPARIAAFAHVAEEGVVKLADYFRDHQEETRIYADLAALGLTNFICTTLWKKYGAGAVQIVHEDPYRLADEVHGIGFAKADEIAANVGITGDNPRRVRAAVLHSMLAVQDRGNTCCVLTTLVEETAGLLGINGAEEYAERQIAACVEAGELVKVEELYALPWMAATERNIAEFLRVYDSPRDWGLDIEAGIRKYGDFLDEDQKDGVRIALTRGGMILTGPGGSGKTTTINVIVKIAEEMGIDVSLCAPTGKAARRMEEVIGNASKTIHRLLEYKPPSEWGRNNENPLNADIIIVDEMSMVDSTLDWKLKQAIRRKASIIMVGDHNQLPPVGPGSVLRDAIRHKLVPIVDLHTVHRAAGDLRKNSALILDGIMAPTAPRVNGKPVWVVDDRHNDETTLTTMLDNLFMKVLPDLGYDPLADVQFMSPRRKGVTLCSEMLSERFQVLHQKRLGREIPPTPEKKRAILYEGDKVIQTKNNYQLDVMNGAQGMVKAATPKLVVKWYDGREMEIPHEMKGDIDLAYWLTVHKMQGDQTKVIVFLCWHSHLGSWDSPMLHRNLGYTASTRARECAFIIGSTKGIKGMLERKVEDKRLTLLPTYARMGK